MENKLKIEQLKNYLGTGLKLEYKAFKSIQIKIIDIWAPSVRFLGEISFIDSDRLPEEDVLFYFKPICYRLSDLDKFIPELGFVPWERLNEMYANYEQGFKIDMTHSDFNKESKWAFFQYHKDNWGCQSWVPFEIYSTIFQWHFWPFGDEYFEQGLVIDKLKHGK